MGFQFGEFDLNGGEIHLLVGVALQVPSHTAPRSLKYIQLLCEMGGLNCQSKAEQGRGSGGILALMFYLHIHSLQLDFMKECERFN